MLVPKNNRNNQIISEHAVTRISIPISERYNPAFANMDSREAQELVTAVEVEVLTVKL